MDDKFLKPYDSKATEEKIYKMWEESGFFNPDNLPSKPTKPFTIIMPPPNANGHLHAGHALFITLEDLMTRYKRMQGYKALWVPGADHAGFETQVVYEKKLEKEGRSRFDLSREQLYKEILDFTLENKQYMENDVRRMGASCDWSREKFTLEPSIVAEAQKTFKKLFDDDLVYRGKRTINWCFKHQTSLSDLETESTPKKDKFYYLKYGPFTIATARPETKFGDKYVVMHPKDQRYAKFNHGDKFELEWINGPITATVIKDDVIDMEFGTGVMTITPWHDAIDFDIAKRHNLDYEQIIGFDGKLLPIAGEFTGMKIAEAREKLIEKLDKKGLLEKTEDYEHNVPCCYKCGTVIEPQIMNQWFVKMQPLAKLALESVKRGEVKFVPDNYEKIFNYWMENTIDWNISRQIVWGIPIPAKVCNKCNSGIADLEDREKLCKKCGGDLRKETDTFDTWFSSGQWPLLALGYPNSNDFKAFYPTDVMQTGYDLIFKWVPRMVIFGLYLEKKAPFHTVYLSGLVNDAKGKKMSKSKGNVVDPIAIIDKYGADALRMSLLVGNPPGADMALSEEKINAYKKFSNKIWNITRFVLQNQLESFVPRLDSLSEDMKKNFEEWKNVLKEITEDIDEYRFYLAAEKLYHYIWHTFADSIIEKYKNTIISGTDAEKEPANSLLSLIFIDFVKTLHPFMPFITEEVWQTLPKNLKAADLPLMVTSWPK